MFKLLVFCSILGLSFAHITPKNDTPLHHGAFVTSLDHFRPQDNRQVEFVSIKSINEQSIIMCMWINLNCGLLKCDGNNYCLFEMYSGTA